MNGTTMKKVTKATTKKYTPEYINWKLGVFAASHGAKYVVHKWIER